MFLTLKEVQDNPAQKKVNLSLKPISDSDLQQANLVYGTFIGHVISDNKNVSPEILNAIRGVVDETAPSPES